MNQHLRQAFAIVTLACTGLLVFSCGGGGGSSSPPPAAPAPPPPPGGTTPPPPAADCSVEVAEGPFTKVWPGQTWEIRSPESQGLCPDELDEGAAYAFSAINSTGAVLVIKNGYVVFERYSNNRTRDDLATSWSVAKSIASLLMGITLEEGYLSNLQQPMADFVPSWRGTPKDQILVSHILTRRTALQTLDGGEFYDSADQLQMALDRPLIGTPGQQLYSYSNADVMLAGEVVLAAVGMDIASYLEQKVSSVIGFQGEWWVDTKDHVLSYCCIDAIPLDFARFGLLYARNGDWNGTQVVNREWIETSTRPASNGVYLYYWWPLNQGFGAFGLNSQIVAIYPEDDLVVLRFSQYTRVGDGSTKRLSGNYHLTYPPRGFDNATFLNQMTDAVR